MFPARRADVFRPLADRTLDQLGALSRLVLVRHHNEWLPGLLLKCIKPEEGWQGSTAWAHGTPRHSPLASSQPSTLRPVHCEVADGRPLRRSAYRLTVLHRNARQRADCPRTKQAQTRPHLEGAGDEPVANRTMKIGYARVVNNNDDVLHQIQALHSAGVHNSEQIYIDTGLSGRDRDRPHSPRRSKHAAPERSSSYPPRTDSAAPSTTGTGYWLTSGPVASASSSDPPPSAGNARTPTAHRRDWDVRQC